MDLQNITNLIEGIGVILVAYWSYNQYTKNKLTDKKIEDLKKEEKKRSAERNDNISKIYFDLYRILIDLKADRVYILQPHPLINNHYISVGFEVKQKGITEIKPKLQDILIQDIPSAVDKMARRDWLIYKSIETEMEDKRVKSFLKGSGTYGIYVRKMSTEKDGWVGSIVVDFMENIEVPIDYAKALILEVAESIQYILPEIPEKECKEKG